MKQCENANGMHAMHDHIASNKQHPTQNFHKKTQKISKTPKNFKETPQKPRSNAWNAWEKRD